MVKNVNFGTPQSYTSTAYSSWTKCPTLYVTLTKYVVHMMLFRMIPLWTLYNINFGRSTRQ